jgi:hypothetical protein
MNKDVRISVDYFTNLKTTKLQRLLGEHGVMCHLRLLCWTGKHRPKGIFYDMFSEDLESVSGWEGKEGKLISHFLDLKLISWLSEPPKGMSECLELNDWKEWNGYAYWSEERSSQAREAAQARWKKYRKVIPIKDAKGGGKGGGKDR